MPTPSHGHGTQCASGWKHTRDKGTARASPRVATRGLEYPMNLRHPIFVSGIFTALCGIFLVSARADVYELSSGGQIVGELIRREETPKQRYVIQTADGATVTIDRSQIKQVVSQTPAELEYQIIKPTYPDTAEGQTKLADWCRDNNLPRARQSALERVVELDPENRLARMALGYAQIDGRWVQPDQYKQEQGYVRYKGNWLLPQEVEIAEKKRKEDLAQKQWYASLKRWRGWMNDPEKVPQVREEMDGVKDPLAVPALMQTVDSDTNRDLRVWCIQALGRIGTEKAVEAIVENSLSSTEDEIRLTCFDQLSGNALHSAVPKYVAALKAKDNERVNRAGYALGKLGDKSAVLPLIDALVTTHKFTVIEGSGNPNQMSAGFSPGGTSPGGMTVGGPKQVTIKRDLNNQQVLDALAAMTGVNLGFDQKAWRSWYGSQRKPVTVDTRRD
jgi:PBS lyase HEAT-like repeat